MRLAFFLSAVLISSALLPQSQAQTSNPFGNQPAPPVITTSAEGSTYVPMDSWIYPELDRLHSLGFLDTAFLGLRPWTRLSIAHMLQESADAIDNSDDEQAKQIYLAVLQEVQPDIDNATTLFQAT